MTLEGTSVREEGPSTLHYLHPLSPFFRIATNLRKAVLPLVALFALRGQLESWYLLFLIPGAIFSLVQYLAVRYRFANDEMVVKQGLIFRNERHIPFQRIQNIDLVQNVLHRALGVAEVRVETASGTEPEAILQVVALPEVDEMRRRVFAERKSPQGGTASQLATTEPGDVDDSRERNTEGTTILTLPVGELIRLGLISNRGIVLLGAAIGLFWEYYFSRQYQPRWGPDMVDSIRIDLPNLTALIVGGAVVGGVALLLLLSVVWTVIRLYGYKLERIGEDLRIEAGLFTRVAATIPRGRIQFLSVRASPLHRLFRRVSVKIETAGADSDETSSLTRQWFIPLLRADQLDEVLARVHPDIWTDDPEWQPISRGARARRLRRATILPVFFSALALLVWWPLSLAILVIWLPPALWYASRSTRVTQWARTPSGILYRDGVFTKKTSSTLLEKIQVVSTHRTPFDIRRGMASLKVDTAGSSVVSHKIHIPMLDESVAETLRLDLARHAAASDFVW